MSPEHAVAPPRRGLFSCDYFKRHLVIVAIDEAHCKVAMVECSRLECMCSLLGAIRGTDFSRSFSKLGGLCALTTASFLALTAIAPQNVEATLMNSLHMSNAVIVRQPLDRPNIHLSASRGFGVKVSIYKNMMYSNVYYIFL